MIDLRSEFKELLEEEQGGVGRWVIVRHFTNEYDERYWKPETKEAVGGPMYKYIDSIVLAYSEPALPATSIRSEGLHRERQALMEESLYRFYVEYDVTVNENDEIFELDYYKEKKPTIIVGDEEEDIDKGRIKPKERFKVRKVEDYRCDEGRIEYKMVYVDKHVFR